MNKTRINISEIILWGVREWVLMFLGRKNGGKIITCFRMAAKYDAKKVRFILQGILKGYTNDLFELSTYIRAY